MPTPNLPPTQRTFLSGDSLPFLFASVPLVPRGRYIHVPHFLGTCTRAGRATVVNTLVLLVLNW